MTKTKRKSVKKITVSLAIVAAMLLSISSAILIPLSNGTISSLSVAAAETNNDPTELPKTGTEIDSENDSQSSFLQSGNDSSLTETDENDKPFSETEAAQIPKSEELVTFIVELNNTALLDTFSVSEISDGTSAVDSHANSQERALDALEQNLKSQFGFEEGFAIGYRYTVATTGLSVTTQFGNKAAIQAMPNVERVYVAPTFELQEDDVEALTSNANKMIGSVNVNGTEYTGKGMKIAIVDTGIVVNHPSFQALSEDKITETSLTEAKVKEVWSKLNASKTWLREDFYKNSKIPFAYNYWTNTFDVSHATAQHDHGTHVAGIAAANKINDTEVVGVAPDAQLLVMQVFNTSGGANWATIMAALEDCVHLDVDAINLSLGSAAGFTDSDADLTAILNKFKNTDVQVVIAAGNDTNSGYMNRTGQNLSKATDPDNGLIASPATATAALSVASADNNGAKLPYFVVDGEQYGFSDTAVTSATNFLTKFKGQQLDFVVVNGYGEAKDYANKTVTDKVVVVSRGGGVSFQDKQKNAQAAGAKAVIVYNNVPGTFSMVINDGGDNIPCISVYKSYGEKLVAKKEGKLTVGNGETVNVTMDNSMSDFSSWGVTPDLKLKPEITGVGGGIYSTRDVSIGGSNYGEMSGTSMASPQVAGAMAVISQYLRTKTFTEGELRKVAANLMMSTATQIMDGTVPYSPRNQGAGLINLTNAVKAGAYLSNPQTSESRPKAELGDSESGVYTFPFTVTNISDTQKTYTVESTVMTADVANEKYMSNSDKKLESTIKVSEGDAAGVFLKYDFNDDGKVDAEDARVLLKHVQGTTTIASSNKHYPYLDVNGDNKTDENDVKAILDRLAERESKADLTAAAVSGNGTTTTTITVPAGQTKTYYATVSLTEADKKFINDNFSNGMYVEGYLTLKTSNSDSANLSMPFLGFYGDWSKAPAFDSANATEASLFPAVIYTNGGKLGVNPYITGGKSGDQYNAISYANPIQEIDLGLLRNAKKVETVVTNATNTSQTYFTASEHNITKSYYNASYGRIFPYSIFNFNQDILIWDGKNNGSTLADGTKATYNIKAYLDDGDNIADDTFKFDVTIDNQKPEIINASELTSGTKKPTQRDGSLYLTLKLKDNHHIAAVMFKNSEGTTMGIYEVDNTPGQEVEKEFDVSGYGSDFKLVVADYAKNETEIDVTLDYSDVTIDESKPKQLDKTRIYGNETYTDAVLSRGWFSANKTDFKNQRNETFDQTEYYYSAEYINGYVLGQRADGSMVLNTPLGTYWKTQVLLKQTGNVGDKDVFVLYDMALDYKTNRLFAVGWRYSGVKDTAGKDTGGNYLFEIKFDSTKNNQISVENVAKINGLPSGVEALTLGCTTEGQLYTISGESKLYKLDATNAKADYVGETPFKDVENYSGANVIQSMGYDHNTNKMYWFAHSQTKNGNSYINVCQTYEVDLTNAQCTVVGNYGPSGNTSLFVPTDKKTTLFEMGVQATDFELSEEVLTLANGQTTRVTATWVPWNAKAENLTWTSQHQSVATVDSRGNVKAVGPGETTVTAEATLKDGTKKTHTVTVKVVQSASAIYGYVINDTKNAANMNNWVTFADSDPINTTKKITSSGNQMWQGGTYYNGYVYTVSAEGSMGAKSSKLYKSQVTKGTNGQPASLGTPVQVGSTIEGIEIGNISYDYSTGRIYGVDYTNGGLLLIDVDTGEIDVLGVFNGDLGAAIMTAMTVTIDGIIIGADMYGNLYEVNPDTLKCTKIASIGQDTWYYAGMTYDHNTGNIYWNPCSAADNSPLYLVHITPSSDKKTVASVKTMKLGSVSSSAGVELTAMFTIPNNEPQTNYIKVESIEITNGNVTGLEKGTLQLYTKTNPVRPTANAKKWISDHPEIVTVDEKRGKLTFIKEGTAKITVSIQNKGTDTSIKTHSIDVTVKKSAEGEMIAFLGTDEGGTGYYDYWLGMNDYAPQEATFKDRMINTYSLRTGEYYDGYIYAYNDKYEFYRINEKNYADYVTLGTLKNTNGTQQQVVSMTFDYKTGTMYGVTIDQKLVKISLTDGSLSDEKQLNFNGSGSGKVFAIAVDKNGTLYGVGADAYYTAAKLYTIDTSNGTCTKIKDLPDVRAFTGASYYGEVMYSPQMTYNYELNRLYLNATTRQKSSKSYNSGFWMIELADDANSKTGEEKVKSIYNFGPPSIKNQYGVIKSGGDLYLGLLVSKPRAADITDQKVTGIVLDKSTAVIKKDKTVTLKATLQPSSITDKTIEWKSENQSVATVDTNGVVTGQATGTAKITATYTDNSNGTSKTVTASCEVKVVESTSGSKAYTISADKSKLISFDPEVPGETTDVVTFDKGKQIVGMDMIDENSFYYVVEDHSASVYPQLYHYNLDTKTSTRKGTLEVNIGNAADMAYDSKNGLIYVVSGFYIYQFEASKIQPDSLNHASATFDTTAASLGLPALHAVACKDGWVYFLANNNQNKLYKINDKLQLTSLVSLGDVAVNTASGKSEMAYDAGTDTFYLTDAADKLYSLKITDNGTNDNNKVDVTPIDVLGTGIDINGLAIWPNKKKEQTP